MFKQFIRRISTEQVEKLMAKLMGEISQLSRQVREISTEWSDMHERFTRQLAKFRALEQRRSGGKFGVDSEKSPTVEELSDHKTIQKRARQMGLH